MTMLLPFTKYGDRFVRVPTFCCQWLPRPVRYFLWAYACIGCCVLTRLSSTTGQVWREKVWSPSRHCCGLLFALSVYSRTRILSTDVDAEVVLFPKDAGDFRSAHPSVYVRTHVLTGRRRRWRDPLTTVVLIMYLVETSVGAIALLGCVPVFRVCVPVVRFAYRERFQYLTPSIMSHMSHRRVWLYLAEVDPLEKTKGRINQEAWPLPLFPENKGGCPREVYQEFIC